MHVCIHAFTHAHTHARTHARKNTWVNTLAEAKLITTCNEIEREREREI